ncbi:hypothetical protein M406DRAFT_327107 [Cryphonectria parasitica EP155]|uniref:Uncharacterized protein n=1 Tax=Cryphonectria parasitica (strain ATCC 38755 / EP155) TaxID=660469 RepID=A0A9P4Y8Y4_CRYP1|nr:uncharacterized protein M406DRAFT_327107 [Cryphonectria parasitica EP155]KAF3768686.1 hypothetical protein M406DRAFT_327107 [Cryphonectria parasitica EP155]
MADQDTNKHQRPRASSLYSPRADPDRPTSSGSASTPWTRRMEAWRNSRPPSRSGIADTGSAPHTPHSGRMSLGGFLSQYSPFGRHTDVSGSPSSPAPVRGGMSLWQELREVDESEDAMTPSDTRSPSLKGSDSRYDPPRLRDPSATLSSEDRSPAIEAQETEFVNPASDVPLQTHRGDQPRAPTERSRRTLPALQRTLSDVNAAMTRAMTSRATMLRPLLDRLREARLFTDMGSLMDVTLRAQSNFRPLDMEIVEQFAERFIEDFRHRLGHPEAGPVLPVETRDQVLAEMNALGIRMRILMTEVVASTLQTDADTIRSICVDLNRCIGVNASRPGSAGRARARSDVRTPALTRRTSQMSTLSGPERVSSSLSRSLDRERLSAMSHAELVDFTLARDQEQNDLLDEMRDHLETYEERMIKIQEENDTAHEDMLNLRAEIDLEKAKVHEFGKHGLDINGNKVTTPQQRDQEPRDHGTARLEPRIRSRSPHSQARSSGSFLPFPDRSASPQILSTPTRERISSLAALLDEDNDQREQDFAGLQRIIALLNDEDDLIIGFIDRTAQRAALSTRTVSESDATQSSPEVSLHRASTSSAAAAASDDLTKQQLQTRLRIVEQDRDALQRERDTLFERATCSHSIDDLGPRDQERIAFFAERALSFIDRYLNDFIRCSRNLSLFSRVVIEVGRMDKGQQTCKNELQALLETNTTISNLRPTPYERGPQGDGRFNKLEAYQNAWLPNVEEFLNHFVKLFDDVQSLTAKARAWDLANPRPTPNDQPSEPSVHDSVLSGRSPSLLSRATSSISGLIFGAEDADQLYGFISRDAEGSGTQQHPHCNGCEAAVASPAGISVGTCGMGNADEQQRESARSHSSGSSRVSFADTQGQLPITTSPQFIPKSILRRSSARPRSLDIGRANLSRQGSKYAATGTPYPFSMPEGHAARSSSTSLLATFSSARDQQSTRRITDHDTAGHGAGGPTIVQRSADLERPSSMSQFPGGLRSGGLLGLISRKESYRASRGSDSPPTTTISEQGNSRLSYPASYPGPRQVPAAAASLVEDSHVHRIMTPTGSLRVDYRIEGGPQAKTNRKQDHHKNQNGEGAPEPRPVGEQREDGGAGGEGTDEQPAAPQKGQERAAETPAGPRTPLGDQPRRQSGSKQPSKSDGSSRGRRWSEWSDAWSPQAHSPARAPRPNPEWQFLRLVSVLSSWLTYRQLFNLWAIVWFLTVLMWSYLRVALELLTVGVARPRRVRVLPAEEMLSLVLWCIIVGHLTMLVAIGEERKLWLAANPTTASYLRGLRYRRAYPWWSPYEVDFAFLSPAMKSWSVWLHQLYFHRGLGSSVCHMLRLCVLLDRSYRKESSPSIVRLPHDLRAIILVLDATSGPANDWPSRGE